MIAAPKKKSRKGKGGIAKDSHKSVKLESAKPWAMGPKKSEPDDRPRPMRPSGATPKKAANVARFKKLQGVAI